VLADSIHARAACALRRVSDAFIAQKIAAGSERLGELDRVQVTRSLARALSSRLLDALGHLQ
jgi:hypothetical protein